MRKKITIFIWAVVVVFVGIVFFQFVKLSPVLFQVLFNKEITLHQSDDKVNILLLGIGGGHHDGPNLSDSIIFASINTKTHAVKLVSIPRDLWVPALKAKINTAYAYGEEKQKGGGLLLARATVSKVVGQPIDYAVRLDFAGFVKAVDFVGGLDVMVDKTLDDYEYPVEGQEDNICGHTKEEADQLATSASELEAFPCRYKHIHFAKGLVHMNGQAALEFVRSRHATGSEGTDFARSSRQQKVIQAFKKKALSLETLLNPLKLVGIYTAFSENIDTDIPQSSFDDFIKLAQQMKNTAVTSTVIDYGDSVTGRAGLLMHPDDATPYDGEWVLVSRIGDNNFSEINRYVSCFLTQKTCVVSKTPSQH